MKTIVSAFSPSDGGKMLAENATATIYMHFWSTMRRSVELEDGSKLNFGGSTTAWTPKQVRPATHQNALQIVARNSSALMIWGRTHKYGGGVVVEPKITVTKDWMALIRDRPSLETRVRGVPVPVPVADTAIDWSALHLDNNLIVDQRQPFGFPVYRSPEFREIIGRMSNQVSAVHFFDGGAEINDRGRSGWIKYPKIPNGKPLVTLMAGGIVRIIRGDYGGAIDLFDVVERRASEIKNSNLISVLIYKGIAEELSGTSGLSSFRKALEINRFSDTVISFYLFGLLSRNRTAKSDEDRYDDFSEGYKKYGKYLEEGNNFHGFFVDINSGEDLDPTEQFKRIPAGVQTSFDSSNWPEPLKLVLGNSTNVKDFLLTSEFDELSDDQRRDMVVSLERLNHEAWRSFNFFNSYQSDILLERLSESHAEIDRLYQQGNPEFYSTIEAIKSKHDILLEIYQELEEIKSEFFILHRQLNELISYPVYDGVNFRRKITKLSETTEKINDISRSIMEKAEWAMQ